MQAQLNLLSRQQSWAAPLHKAARGLVLVHQARQLGRQSTVAASSAGADSYGMDQGPKLKRARGDDPVPQAQAVSHRVPGLVLKDRFIRVPLDYSGKAGLTAVK
jgi:hypothetical protein